MTAKAERRTSDRGEKESRHRAREAAVQMLYQWEVGKTSMFEVGQTFWTGPAASEPLGDEMRAFATRLATGVTGTVADLDPMIAEAAQNWRIERMNVLDRLILRLAIYEFLHEPETPAKVIINEALELARTFSTDDSVRFINGVLDAVRRTLARE
jgi:N utilization substance protein B